MLDLTWPGIEHKISPRTITASLTTAPTRRHRNSNQNINLNEKYRIENKQDCRSLPSAGSVGVYLLAPPTVGIFCPCISGGSDLV